MAADQATRQSALSYPETHPRKKKSNPKVILSCRSSYMKSDAQKLTPTYRWHSPVRHCYGFQLAAHLLGGQVISGRKEYGPANSMCVTNTSKSFAALQRFNSLDESRDEILQYRKVLRL